MVSTELLLVALSLLIPPETSELLLDPLKDPRIPIIAELEAQLPHLPLAERELLAIRLADLHARFRQEHRAFELLQNFVPTNRQIACYGRIAREFAWTGQITAMLKAIRRVEQHPESEEFVENIWATLARDQARLGNEDLAQDFGKGVYDPEVKSRLLVALSKITLARQNREQSKLFGQQAWTLLQTQNDGLPTTYDLQIRAEACYLAGEMEQGDRFIQQLQQPTNLGIPRGAPDLLCDPIEILARLGDFPRAHRLADLLPTESNHMRIPFMRSFICEEQLRQQGIQAVLPRVTDPQATGSWRESVLFNMVEAELEVRHLSHARALAEQMTHREMQTKLFLKLAEAFHQAGEDKQADELLQQAEDAIAEVKHGIWQNEEPFWLFAELALAEARLKKPDEARKHLDHAARLIRQRAAKRDLSVFGESLWTPMIAAYRELDAQPQARALLEELWQQGFQLLARHAENPQQLSDDLRYFEGLVPLYVKLGETELIMRRIQNLAELPILPDVSSLFLALARTQASEGSDPQLPKWIAELPPGKTKANLLLTFLQTRLHHSEPDRHF